MLPAFSLASLLLVSLVALFSPASLALPRLSSGSRIRSPCSSLLTASVPCRPSSRALSRSAGLPWLAMFDSSSPSSGLPTNSLSLSPPASVPWPGPALGSSTSSASVSLLSAAALLLPSSALAPPASPSSLSVDNSSSSSVSLLSSMSFVPLSSSCPPFSSSALPVLSSPATWLDLARPWLETLRFRLVRF